MFDEKFHEQLNMLIKEKKDKEKEWIESLNDSVDSIRKSIINQTVLYIATNYNIHEILKH